MAFEDKKRFRLAQVKDGKKVQTYEVIVTKLCHLSVIAKTVLIGNC